MCLTNRGTSELEGEVLLNGPATIDGDGLTSDITCGRADQKQDGSEHFIYFDKGGFGHGFEHDF